jgi:2-succinyl-6-hydroxy-2,4-cyclohexadiene-1-carboxylate synthase
MQLAYRHAGEGGRPVVLLHGLAGSGAELDAPVTLLGARGWHAVAPDLRGHGDSPKPDDELAYEVRAMAGDVLALVDSLGWRSFCLVGHEAGGVIAQELAIMAPTWLDSLVLQATAPGTFPLDRNLALGGIELVRGVRSMEPLAAAYREAGAGPVGAGADHLDGILERMRSCAPAAYAAILLQLLDGADRSLHLADLRVPTHVVVGRDDPFFIEPAEDLATTIPGAELYVLPGGGHLPHLDHPEEWAVMVGGFLQASLV